jgi:hypothetical protein
MVRLVMTAAEAEGAADRLAKVRDAINGERAIPKDRLTGGSVVACSAELAV